MIEQQLIDSCKSDLEDFGSLMKCQGEQILNSYIKLVEQNAELQKELARLKSR